MGPVVCCQQNSQRANQQTINQLDDYNKTKIENFEQLKQRILKIIDSETENIQKFMAKYSCVEDGHRETIIGVCINEKCLAKRRQFCQICLLQGLHNKDYNFSQGLILENQFCNMIKDYQQFVSQEFDALNYMLYFENLLYFNLNEFKMITLVDDELNEIERHFTTFYISNTQISIEKYLIQLYENKTSLFLYLKQNYQQLVILEHLIRNFTKKRIKGSIVNSIPGIQNQSEIQGKIQVNKIELLGRLTKTQFYQNKMINNQQAELIQKHLDSIFSYGVEIFNQKQFQAALEIFNEYLRFTPQNSNLHQFIGNSLRKLKKFNEAQHHLDLAVQLNPKNQIAFLLKGKLLFQIKQYWDSIKMFDHAIKLTNHDYLTYLKKGKILIKMRLFDEASKALNMAYTQNPNNHLIFFYSGIIYEQLKQYQRAQQQFEKSFNLNQFHYLSVLKNGKMHYQLKNYGESLNLFKQAAQLNQENYLSYLLQGMALKKLSLLQDAILMFERTIQLNKQAEKAYRFIEAQIFFIQEQYDLALQMYTEAIELNPQKCRNFINKGIIFCIQQKYQEALDVFNKARLIISPKKYEELIFCIGQQKKCQGLIEFKSSIMENEILNYPTKKCNISSVQFYMNMSQLSSSSDKLKIQLLYENATKIDPENNKEYISVMISVGDYYYRLQKYDEALQMYDKAISLRVIYKAYFKKGITLSFLGKHQEAILMYEIANYLNPFDQDVKRVKSKIIFYCSLSIRQFGSIKNLIIKMIYFIDNFLKAKIIISFNNINMQLQQWFSQMGIIYMKSDIQKISDKNYGLVASSHIDIGTVIAQIPQETLISVKKLKTKYRKIIKGYPHIFLDLLNDDFEFNLLALFMQQIIKIRLLEKEGQYKTYFESAHPENILSMNIELITDNNLQSTIRNMKLGLQKNYQYFQTLFLEQFDAKLKYEDFLFAYQFVMTRCFAGDEALESTSLVPFGDMLNHHWKCQIEFTFKNNNQAQDQYLYVKALEVIEKGEQIYNFFGNKHNGFLFLWYGFCFEENIYDKIFLILENDIVVDYSAYEFPSQKQQFVLKHKIHKVFIVLFKTLSQNKQQFNHILNQLEQQINRMLNIPIPQYQILLKSHLNILKYQKQLNI